jgi:hypothetical protein
VRFFLTKLKGLLMKTIFNKLLDIARRHIIMVMTAKFVAGLVIGFGLGVYFLPIIIADAPVDQEILQAQAQTAERQAIFTKDREGSDLGHWGEGILYLSDSRVTLDGEVSPGPDYRLYLTPKFVETSDAFRAIKADSVEVARIKGFKNFSYEIPSGIDTSGFESVVVWCERFGVYITSGPLTPRDG